MQPTRASSGIDENLMLSYRGPATIDALDQEILRVQRYLTTLQDRRNMLLTVSKLPTEIVRYIFLLCMNITSDDHLTNAKRGGRKTVWPGFSQTCRSWRNIALGCPSLWTQPRFDRPQAAAEMLKHSASVAKEVFIDYITANATYFGRQTLMEALDGVHGPVHALHLRMHRSRFSEVRSTIEPLLGSLKYLTLEQRNELDGNDEDGESLDDEVIDTANELDDIAEHLVGLRLVNVAEDFGLRFNSFPSLTQLVLDYVP